MGMRKYDIYLTFTHVNFQRKGRSVEKCV